MSNALSNRQIVRAAFMVLLGFLASGVLGVVRTAVFAATFGASHQLDAFLAAQRIPEALFVLVAGGALGSAFIPVFTRLLDRNPEQAWRFASATMTFSALSAMVLSAVAFVTAPWFVPWLIAPDSVGTELQTLTIHLMQIMLLTPMIFSVSGLVMGILNAHQLFMLPSIAISMNNIGLIIGALLFSRWIAPAPNVEGLAWGAVLAALLHLLVQVPGLIRIQAHLRPLPDWHIEGVAEVLRLMAPRVLGLGLAQLNFIVNARLAIPMLEGSYTALVTAWGLMFTALGIIAQSVGTALFPTLSHLVAQGDRVAYRERLANAMQSVLFLALPATVALIFVGEPLVAFIAQRGLWTAESTRATAWALGFFALGIAGHSLLEVLSRAFYALADTWTPVWVGAVALLANIVLSFVFIQWVGDSQSLVRGSFAGLALANSITTLVEGAVLWILLSRRVGGIHDRITLWKLARVALASLVMGGVLWVMIPYVSASSPLWRLLIMGVGGGMTFFMLAWLLRLPEASTVPLLIMRRLRR
ncbi:MAG: murein biosynthesis integral membrane protein MurJ [Phototrophicaceae bacterium]